MKSSVKPFSMPLLHVPKWLLVVFFVAALVGFADSAYLTAQHVRGVIPPCGPASECEAVLTSSYASVGPIPVSALGLFYYGAILMLLVAYMDSGTLRFMHWVRWITHVGLVGTLYFVALQAFVLHAWCLYCLVSALMTLLLFLCAVYTGRINKI